MKMGSVEARLIKYARSIKTREQLDVILAEAASSGVAPNVMAAWLEKAIPHLPFKIEGLSNVDNSCTIGDVSS